VEGLLVLVGCEIARFGFGFEPKFRLAVCQKSIQTLARYSSALLNNNSTESINISISIFGSGCWTRLE
jgi:hypothetical protein